MGKYHHFYMVIQEEEGTIWKDHKEKIPPVRTQGHATMGVNYWETYSPVVNWISSRAIITLTTLIYIHAKYIYIFLAYNQADVKLEIFLELHI